MKRYGAAVQLERGAGGIFDITVDGRLAFSKRTAGRFPDDADLDGLA